MDNENVKNVTTESEGSSGSPKKRVKAIDIVAYVLCLAVAFGIWAYVTSMENGEYEYRFTGVLVNLEGVPVIKDSYGLSPIGGSGTEVAITVKGLRSEILKYTAEDIFAYVDLSKIDKADRYSLDIIVDLPDNMQLVSAEPSKINVFVDEMIDKQVPIEVETLYSSSDNVVVEEPVIDESSIHNGMITVTGPKSVVDYIDHALVVKDLGFINTGVRFNSQFTLVDDNGDTVTNPYVKTDVSDVWVSVKVTLSKVVPLKAEYTQDPDDKYKYSVIWKYDGNVVDNVTVKGDPAKLENLDVLSIFIKSIADYPNGNAQLPEEFDVYIGENKIRTISYTVVKELIEPNG